MRRQNVIFAKADMYEIGLYGTRVIEDILQRKKKRAEFLLPRLIESFLSMTNGFLCTEQRNHYIIRTSCEEPPFFKYNIRIDFRSLFWYFQRKYLRFPHFPLFSDIYLQWGIKLLESNFVCFDFYKPTSQNTRRCSGFYKKLRNSRNYIWHYIKIVKICWYFHPPWKSPRYSLYRRLGGPQNPSGRRGEETHLAPARNQIPAVHPHARRDDTDKTMITTECTPLHIYFSLDFSLQLPHLCVPAPTNLTLLQLGLY
jgi:hypothetical protein